MNDLRTTCGGWPVGKTLGVAATEQSSYDCFDFSGLGKLVAVEQAIVEWQVLEVERVLGRLEERPAR